MKKGFIYSVNKEKENIKKAFMIEHYSDIVIPERGGFLLEPFGWGELPADIECVNDTKGIVRMADHIPDIIVYVLPCRGRCYKVTYFEGEPPL